jgi:hypothetical protein
MKKGIAIFLIPVLIIDLTSCTRYMVLSTGQDFESYNNEDEVQVLGITSNQDGFIEFNEDYPGKIDSRHVVGLRQIHFPYSPSNTLIFNTKDPGGGFIMNNGSMYRIISQNRSGFTCLAVDTTRIPFSDITQINVVKKDPMKTTLLVFVLSTIVIGITGYLISSDFAIYTQGM